MGNKSYSKGISWFDDCRIGFEDRQNQQKIFANGNGGVYKETNSSKNEYVSVKGRFPANILVCDDMLNDGKIYESGKGLPHHKRNKTLGEYQGNAYGKYNNVNPQINFENYYGDKGTNSRYYNIDKWFDNILNG